MALIEARDREFHQHIVKNRVDPRAQSATNPVPDFYGEPSSSSRFRDVTEYLFPGEKIGSLHQYRQVRQVDSFVVFLSSDALWCSG
jgi:mitochondrial import inner membrane translocase subunit TIM23